jgi:hypothetical protein
MPEPLPDFRLGIIGGCMSHQRGTPVNALYHRVLAELVAAEPGIRLRVRVVRAFDADLLTRLRMVDPSQVDGVLVHLRAASLVAPVPIVRRTWRDGRLRASINPALLGRSRAGAGVDPFTDAYDDSPDLQDVAPAGPAIAGFRIRNLNVALGCVIGLDRPARHRLLADLDSFKAECRSRQLPFFVLGPAPTTYSWWTNRIVRKGEAAIRKRLAGSDVPYALIERDHDDAGRPLTRADGTHLTIAGQRFVGRLLYERGIGSWMERSLAARA